VISSLVRGRAAIDFVKFAVERSHVVLEILDKKLEIF
jgi:hypothetical protein